MTKGSVFLVGAGPGDPELLTLKAVRVLGKADVVLVDDLVGDSILDYVKPGARVIPVGKRGGCASTPQAFIERLMVQEAKAGHCVVRLKGGDPMIFGRGGEEIDALRRAGIAVEVINGITSGLAAATALNTSLTHRDHAHGVVFITGHTKPADNGTDWAALGQTAHRAKLSLVVYMGISQIEAIVDGLLQGLPAHTPAVVVQSVSLPAQRQHATTLGMLAADVRRQALQSPSVLLIGQAFADTLAVQAHTEQAQRLALA